MAKKEAKAPKKYIVRYVKKHVEEFHGGAWKVAYAGFVTAMMAFFLLLWLIAASTPQKKIDIVKYFTHFSLTGREGILVGLGKVIHIFDDSPYPVDTQPDKITKEILIEINKQLSPYKGKNINIERTSEGNLKILLFNNDNKEEDIFLPGSDALSGKGKEIIDVVSGIIKNTKLQISIEGHIDSSPFERENNITGWELTAFRASKARREFQEQGIDESRFNKIAGYADKQLKYKENPLDARNNRIDILISSPETTYTVSLPDSPKDVEPSQLSQFMQSLRNLEKGSEIQEKKGKAEIENSGNKKKTE